MRRERRGRRDEGGLEEKEKRERRRRGEGEEKRERSHPARDGRRR